MLPASLNQNLASRRGDKFYVKFLGVDNNTSNILGRQLREIEMPIISFNIIEERHKTSINKHQTNLTFEEINVQFDEDVNGITLKLIYDLAFKQASQNHDLFIIKIELLDHNGLTVREITLRDVFIQNVSVSQLNNQTSSEKSLISVSFVYCNIDHGVVTNYSDEKNAYFDSIRSAILGVDGIPSGSQVPTDAGVTT